MAGTINRRPENTKLGMAGMGLLVMVHAEGIMPARGDYQKRRKTGWKVICYGLLAAGFFMGCGASRSVSSNAEESQDALLQVCPDSWIVNRMPRITEQDSSGPPSEYFILDGKRRELDEFDVEWIRANCKISPQEVW